MRTRTVAVAVACVAVLGPWVAPGAHAHELVSYRAERHHIEARARGRLGDPYRSGGTSPSGFDCSGFTRWVFAGHGAYLPHSAAAQFDLAGRGGYRRIWDRRDLEPGDLVFFQTTSARVGHVGIYLGHDKFISSTTSSGVHVDSVYDPYYWGSRWVGATRAPATTASAYPQGQQHEHQLQ